MTWARLVRGGEVLTAAELATTRRARRRGLLGRDDIATAMVLRPCRQVHTIGMRFGIDVVWCDRRGRVLRVATLRPHRLSRPVLRSRFVIETGAGNAARWRLRPGDRVELLEAGAPGA